MKKFFLILASILMILLGLLRGIGGFILLIQGKNADNKIITSSDLWIHIVAIGLIFIFFIFLISAINLIRKQTMKSWIWCWLSIFLFLAGGLFNGYILYGQPLATGQKINFTISLIIGLCLLSGKSQVKNQ